MQVEIKLDESYGNDAEKTLNAKGFVLNVGDYDAPVTSRIKLTFDEGLALLTQLTSEARRYHIALTRRLDDTGRLAAVTSALDDAAKDTKHESD